MNEVRIDRFSVFESLRKATVRLPDELRLKIYDIVFDYGFYGTEPEFSDEQLMLECLFESIRPNIDSSIRRTAGGRKGGATKTESEACEVASKVACKVSFLEEEVEVDVEVEEDVEVDVEKDKDIEKTEGDTAPVKDNTVSEKRFVPPSVEDTAAYCAARKNSIDPQTFVDFYSAKGWMVGKNKMKDWRAAVRTWEKRHSNDQRGSPSGESEYDYF